MKIVVISLVAIAVIVFIVIRLLRGRLRTETADAIAPPTPAREVSEVSAFTIQLKIEEKAALFILLADDGTINRLGTGAIDNTEHELLIGKTDLAPFQSTLSHLGEAIMRRLGQGYEMNNPKGAHCKLTLTFKFNDGTFNGLGCLYGSESEGPPQEVREFVMAAVAQTDPWYEDFRRNALRRNEN